MPGNTPLLSLPYPLGNETADPGSDIRNLALAVDGAVETPAGAQAKADVAQANAEGYTDTKFPIKTINLSNPPMFSLPNLLHPSAQQFTRGSNASRKDLTQIPYNVPRHEQGRFGQGIFIEEGTTNLVYNSDFETITGTAKLFADPLTSYSGSSAAPWQLWNGSFSYSASGATSTADGSSIGTKGHWKPLLGSEGQNLDLCGEATFILPSIIKSCIIRLLVDGNNFYQINADGTNFNITKLVGGTSTVLTNVLYTLSANSTYTLTLSIDHTGLITGNLYSGVGTGGTLLQTITAIDIELSGSFLLNLCAGIGTIINNASVKGPWADGWTINGDTRIAWSLTQTNPISGNYSVSAVGIPYALMSPAYARIQRTLSITPGVPYSFSFSMNANSVGSATGVISEVDFSGGTPQYFNTGYSSGTLQTSRYFISSMTPTAGNTTAKIYLRLDDSGTAVFDAIQLEQKSYATTYIRNDSTSGSASRSADSLQYNLYKSLPSRWFGALYWTPNFNSASLAHDSVLLDINNQSVYSHRLYLQSTGKIDFGKTPDNGTTWSDITSSIISFNAGDKIFIACLDDPVTSGQIVLWVGINGGTLQKYSLANTTQVTSSSVICVGCYGGGAGAECNGIVDFPLITATIPTDEQVNALYYAAEWGGIRNYPGALPDKVTIGDPRAKLSRSRDGSLQLAMPILGNGIQLGVGGNTNLLNNCYYDELTNQWNRVDITKPAYLIDVGSPPAINYASAGANPITWQAYPIPQILSGGYKVQSGETTCSFIQNTWSSTTITFPVAFSSAPIVVAGVRTNYRVYLNVSSPSTTGYTLNGYDVDANIAIPIDWIAIGS